jgi:N-methylhydantoinase A
MTSPSPPCHVGVDVGGTFTDLVLYDPDGQAHCLKVASTPAEPGRAALQGIDQLRAMLTLDAGAWAGLQHTHSSTVATNALLERRGATVGLLVTAGFRDVLELQRLALPHPMRFDSRRPTPIVPRRLVREVAERVRADGTVVTPLDRAGLLDAAGDLLDQGVDVLAVCFLHSYRTPAHEHEARDELGRAFPGVRVDLSSAVWPQAREYERAALTAVNAFVRPVVERHVGELADGLLERGVRAPARVSRSNGGSELAASLLERPAAALLSGPAAGVAGAALAAAWAGLPGGDLVTFDVGGTSADVGVVRDGRPVLSSEESMAGFPLLLPTVAVTAIGAGGGSVIRVDDAGSLRVGPRSVGADPGPACYGTGAPGTAALTDAFLVAGLLDDQQLLGGTIAVRSAPAERALAEVGAPIGLTADEVADGAIRIATAAMAATMITVLARRGVDATDATMVAYGGAGPLLAALVAEECALGRVLVPAVPGALCALGATFGDLEGDLVEPVYRVIHQLTGPELQDAFARLDERVERWLAGQAGAIGINRSEVEVRADMRFDGQGYDLTVRVRPDWPLAAVADAFRSAHAAAFGHVSADASIWLNELRAHVVGHTAKPRIAPPEPVPARPRTTRTRTVVLGAQTFPALVHHRDRLAEGDHLTGPAVVTQMDATTFVPPGWRAEVVGSGALLLTRSAAGGAG